MKRTAMLLTGLVAVGLVALMASHVHAIATDIGGTIVWNTITGTNTITDLRLRAVIVDEGWNASLINANTKIETINWKANTDTALMANTNNYLRAVEVYDPRQSGGAGRLLITAYKSDTAAASKVYGILLADCALVARVGGNAADGSPNYTLANKKLITMGSSATNDWSSVEAFRAMAAPKNFQGKTSNDRSLFLSTGAGDTYLTNGSTTAGRNTFYLFDKNANDCIDVTSGGDANREKTSIVMPGGRNYLDMEFSSTDQAIFRSFNYTASPDTKTRIERVWSDSNGGSHYQEYFKSGDCATGGLGLQADGMGIAVGPGTASYTAPIVYVLSVECATLGSRPSIWALQDRTGDNVVTWGTTDIIKEVWCNGQNGITLTTHSGDTASQYAGEDIEFVMNPDTHVRTLVWNTFSGDLLALNLADNCLEGAGTGKKVLSYGGAIGGPSLQYSGFELDMNPVAAIPEPGTLLLLGTGALGALGYLRRRRMK